jgi:octaprenyl-diphosphate synthase
VKSLEQIISPIAAELAQFEAFFRQTLRSETEPMDTIICYVLETTGKRLRPLLVLLSAKLFGEVNEQTLRAATFVEMVHTATLIHDDVVDDADIRRSNSSVKARFGNLSAVLAGDYLLAKAMLLLGKPNDHAILQEMLNTTAAMSEGELMQANGADQYLEIITRKTAMLMRSCCVAGALSVGATPEQIEKIAEFGLHFGIVFQLRDDLNDGENTVQAAALLPIYKEKALLLLEGLYHSEILDTFKDLTEYCIHRKE